MAVGSQVEASGFSGRRKLPKIFTFATAHLRTPRRLALTLVLSLFSARRLAGCATKIENVKGVSEKIDLLALADQAAGGDARAQRQLLDKLRRRVQSIALSIMGDALDAEDSTQVALMEILKSLASFRGENLFAWSDRIAVRTAIRHARQRRVRGLRFQPTEDLDEFALSSDTSDPYEPDLPRELRHYLAQLPEARRVVLVLRHMMDYSIEEIAELTEASPNTVKDRLLHAREEVRRAIRRDQMLSLSRGHE
jgi:RNA polymerase sigma-70 factor, ECF subfamily